jgi:hypothetical protein
MHTSVLLNQIRLDENALYVKTICLQRVTSTVSEDAREVASESVTACANLEWVFHQIQLVSVSNLWLLKVSCYKALRTAFRIRCHLPVLRYRRQIGLTHQKFINSLINGMRSSVLLN